MRRTVFLVPVILLGIVLLGCAASQTNLPATKDNPVPEWFSNLPRDKNFFFAANTATSQDLQLAIDKATTGARAEIGRQTDLKLEDLQKRFDEEVGLGGDSQLRQQFTQASKTVMSTTLTGSRIKYQKHIRDGNAWRAYVLVEYPIGTANQALMQKIKENEEMRTRFQASKTFQELEEEVQKYEEWKKQQQALPK